MSYRIELARADEVEALRALEDAAGVLYGQVGLPPDLEGLSPADIEESFAARAAFVARDLDGALTGMALCWSRPEALHLRELDVSPAHMRRGLGRQLVEHCMAEAAARGLPRVTLTTFRDVPFNAPLYRRWGFEVLSPEATPAFLREILAAEANGVLGRWPRVAMARSAGVDGSYTRP